jgi:hypothetical protein
MDSEAYDRAIKLVQDYHGESSTSFWTGGDVLANQSKTFGQYRSRETIRRRTRADRFGRHVGDDAGVDGSETSVDQGDGRAGR